MEDRERNHGISLIIGGSGGVGAAACRALAMQGRDIVLTYRRGRARAESLRDELEKMGCRTAVMSFDLDGDHRAFLAEVVDVHGPIESLVVATGSDIRMRWISEISDDEWDRVTRVDAQGTCHLIRQAIPWLRETKGSIVVVSTAGLARYPTRDILSVAPKAMVDALVQGVAREEGRHGIRANTVALGVIETGIFERLQEVDFSEEWMEAARSNTALGRFGRADEVGEVIAFLASHRASYVTGQTIYCDGGYRI